MNRRLSWLRTLAPVDALVILFLAGLGIYVICRSGTIHEWFYIVLANLAGSVTIIALAASVRSPRRTILRFMHEWYPVIAIFLIFKEVYVVIQSLGLQDWDDVLIACDHFLFHADPTVWLMRFSSPVLTEILQLAYVSYYLLMIALGIELYARRQTQNFSFTIFTITYGFLLSYIGCWAALYASCISKSQQ
jgi:hypothetical protein